MTNTGAVIDGHCPGCGNRIVGMMPQRCFLCGYDFTQTIKTQNPDFHPDPNFKSPIGDVQGQIRAVADRLAFDAMIVQYGPLCPDFNCDHEYCQTMRQVRTRIEQGEIAAQDQHGDPLGGLADALGSEMDRQKIRGEELQKRADEALRKHLEEQHGLTTTNQVFEAMKAAFPEASVEAWKAELDDVYRATLTFPSDRIIIEVDTSKRTT